MWNYDLTMFNLLHGVYNEDNRDFKNRKLKKSTEAGEQRKSGYNANQAE